MIEIQCSSCHTRYRIDERVLPADSPTFKCSRCGHVFTADPVAAKKVAAEPVSKPQASRVSTPRPEPKRPVDPSSTSTPQVEAPKSVASEDEAAEEARPQSDAESKPAPIRPYIRNPRPTIFDRASDAQMSKPAPEPSSAVDPAAVARMKAAVEKPKSDPPAMPPRRPSQPQHSGPGPSRPTQRPEAADEPENLAFDFNDEEDRELGSELSDGEGGSAPERWSVGEDALETPSTPQPGFSQGEPDPGFSRGEPAPIGRGTIAQYAAAAFQRSPLPDERGLIEREGLRSARSFIGLFFMIALMFIALTLVVYGIPSASAELLRRMPMIGSEFVQPTPLENFVTVSDVQSSYQSIKDGHSALVLTGVVKNGSSVALHTIQVGVRLLDAAKHDVASSAVYCGTTLSPRMIGEMTPHELEFLQKLDPQKNFTLEPGHNAPFLMVFIDPPRNLSHFAVAVAKAQPAATTQSGQQASVRQ
jgi:predicted Zn finger-like uncharacterized protein